MKKKFDFSAEMNDAESIKATQKNEYLEEEKRLLKVNVKELANLNDNVHKMSINLVNFDIQRFINELFFIFCLELRNNTETKSSIKANSDLFYFH